MLAEIMLWESDGNYLVNELLYVSKNFYNVIQILLSKYVAKEIIICTFWN